MTGSGGIQLPPPPPLRPRTVGEILEAAFALYRRSWQTLMLVVAIPLVPLSILQYYVDSRWFTAVEVRNGTITVSRGFGESAGSVFVLWAVTVLVTLILVGAIAWAVGGALVGRDPTVAECYRFGYVRIWSILWVGVLSTLAIVAGFILLVIPGFIVLVHLVCTIPAVVVERRRGGDALSRSWQLVRGHAWPVFGALIVTALLTGIVNGVFTAIAGNGWFAQGVAAAVGSVITTPFTALVVGLIYFDLRVRTEQLDVATLDAELRAAAA